MDFSTMETFLADLAIYNATADFQYQLMDLPSITGFNSYLLTALYEYYLMVDAGQDALAPKPEVTVDISFDEEPEYVTCEGEARVLEGNPDLIGKPGGFSGTTVGPILVEEDGFKSWQVDYRDCRSSR